jgi:hypothetical protein
MDIFKSFFRIAEKEIQSNLYTIKPTVLLIITGAADTATISTLLAVCDTVTYDI